MAEVYQKWRASAHVMQAHENHYIKRAGVAGLRARATGIRLDLRRYLSYKYSVELKGARG